MVHNAIEGGYTAVVLNHLVPKDELANDFRCLDFAKV